MIAHQCDRAFVWQGDSLELMRDLPDESVDSVVTDPPYNLSFMGKRWDTVDGSFQHWCEEWARECLRLLKPGGHLLAFGGTRTWHRLASGIEDAGFELRDSIAWMYGQGFPKSKALLKPAFEPIVFARKPGPLQELNLDACRVGKGEGARVRVDEPSQEMTYNGIGGDQKFTMKPGPRGGGLNGRWPANVVLDESQAAALDEQSGHQKDGVAVNRNRDIKAQKKASIYGRFYNGTNEDAGFGGGGGASRFFKVVPDPGLAEDPEPPALQDSRFLYSPKASSKERPKVEGSSAHPTVKPLSLMRWLVRLVTPADGLVLDPFAGSGTTVEAAMLEGFRCMGMEREAEYIPLILHRVERAKAA